jgi:glyoxylate reductase
MARCFVTHTLPGTALDRLGAEHEVEVWSGAIQPSRRKLIEEVTEAEGLLCMLSDTIDAEVIEGAPQLRAISTYSVGTDNVDLAAATARRIPVGNTPDVLTDATADFAFALMLAAARRVVEGRDLVDRGAWVTWEPELLLGQEVHGATLGIVGFGRIGQAVAKRAEGFDMRFLNTSSSGGTPLTELLAESDFVSIHCPLTEETRGLIGLDELQAMKDTAILINTARGPIVDTVALDRGLRAGWIGGAALDVTDPEPLPSAHPLRGAPNLLITPHIGSASHLAREAMADVAVDNLVAGLAAKPMPSCVNPEAHE